MTLGSDETNKRLNDDGRSVALTSSSCIRLILTRTLSGGPTGGLSR